MAEPAHEYTERDPVVAQYERWMYPEPVANLGMMFDYISCHGVRHHLPDAGAGLRRLAGSTIGRLLLFYSGARGAICD
jgi:hypothetical protein